MNDERSEVIEWERATADNQSPISNLQSPANRLVSISQRYPDLSTTTFLRQAQGKERFFWQDGRSPVIFAAFGVAANLMAWGKNRFQDIEQQARALFHDAIFHNDRQPLSAPRLFGGFAFRDDFTPDNTWSVFHPAHFILPHYQLVQVEDETWLTINALIPADENPDAILPQLRDALQARYEFLVEGHPSPLHPPPTISRLNYPMSRETWGNRITEATGAMGQGSTGQGSTGQGALKKVVLSRVCEIRFDQRVDVDGALNYLHEHYTGCYRFLFEPRPFHAFYGATPELLAQVNGRILNTMSLAGSIQRGATPMEDAALGQQLLNDPKNRHEHDIVVASMLNRLAPFTTQLEIAPQPGVYKLRNIQHLLTPIRGQLQESLGILPIVAHLHPTPAMGGSPRELAMNFIRQAEPVPRGWYAAPIGWIDHEMNGTFAVAIRSAVTQEKRVWLYAGAGIVADSKPELEWEETALKFKPMLNALGLETGD
jgi:menaquinone-specific isochorismate synthase